LHRGYIATLRSMAGSWFCHSNRRLLAGCCEPR
jgi:hypothetical protein